METKMLVVGLGKSGVAAALYGVAQGNCVTVTDQKSADDLPEAMAKLHGMPVRWELGGHSDELFAEQDLIVVSPGVPLNLPALKTARAKNIPIVGEMELALQQIDRPIISVTGTNGKTTTVTLIDHLLKTAGKKSLLAGNVGTPLLQVFLEAAKSDWVVLEVSSYQLETTPSLVPTVSIWLNVTEDHLDWHESFENYAAAKAKMMHATRSDGLAIYNADDSLVAHLVSRIPKPVLPFSVQRQLKIGGWVEEGALCIRLKANQPTTKYFLADLPLKGIHNWQNMLAAVLAVSFAGLPEEAIRKGLQSFFGLPHRMQSVGTVRGVHYINDSKATNVGAVEMALASVQGRVLWIAGGRDKGGSYAPLLTKAKGKVCRVILFGEARKTMQKVFEKEFSTAVVNTLEEATKIASREAKPGETVLFSPACSSFDQFTNYAERGEYFKALVKKIII